MSDLHPWILYDQIGAGPRDCVWNAYSAGTPTRWSVTAYTTEGAPIPETLRYEGGVILMTRDLSADAFSSPSDRRIWSWRCGAMTKRPYTNATRPYGTDSQVPYSFELSGCTGEVSQAVFP